MSTIVKAFAGRFFPCSRGWPHSRFSLFQPEEVSVTAPRDLWRTVVEIRGLLLVDGLAASVGPGERARGTPGVEVTAGEMPGMVCAGRQNADMPGMVRVGGQNLGE